MPLRFLRAVLRPCSAFLLRLSAPSENVKNARDCRPKLIPPSPAGPPDGRRAVSIVFYRWKVPWPSGSAGNLRVRRGRHEGAVLASRSLQAWPLASSALQGLRPGGGKQVLLRFCRRPRTFCSILASALSPANGSNGSTCCLMVFDVCNF